jgi:hypothetical protein
MHALSRGLGHRTQEGAGAALAVGPGDMDHRRQAAFRVIEPIQQGAQTVQAEVNEPGMQPLEAGRDLFDTLVHAAA